MTAATTHRLPDDETTVLLSFQSGEVWTGYRLGDLWHHASADQIGESVLYWADFPDPPESTA